MSVTLTQPETYTCSREECEQTFPETKAVDGSYCSERCASLVAGRNLIQHIRADHRFCHGCFRQLKQIERPPADRSLVVGPVDHDDVANTFRDVLVGYEYLTEHAELGEREHDAFVAHEDTERPSGPGAAVAGTVCSCGTTDHRDPYLREADVVSLRDAARRLCDILGVLGAEGQHDKTIHGGRLLSELEATADDDDADLQWGRAVGRAIED